ncbi:MAG: hypothetical protein KJ666_15555 [Bacteroidetes bacterium]|nr:hypothetical protein [Bacteroidota bacterium]MBU2584549.1 hypothetical protein [Bacteroidota bacterium]
MQIDLKNLEKKVDNETGSILFYRQGFQGLPDKVIQKDGFTIELKNDEIVLIDIYKPELMLRKLIDEAA